MSHKFKQNPFFKNEPAKSEAGMAYILVDEDGNPVGNRLVLECRRVDLTGPVPDHMRVKGDVAKAVEGLSYECSRCQLMPDFVGLCHKHEELSCEVVEQHFAVHQVMAK